METLGRTGGASAGNVEELLSGVGARVREARRSREITLEALSAASGVSVAHLSRLESGARHPSLAVLLNVASGLGVRISDLLEGPHEPEPGTVVRGSEAPVYEGPGFRLQPLVPEAGPEGIAAVKVVYPADRPVNHELHQHEGQEWLYMLTGRLRLTLGVEATVLEPGDAAFFDARLPHRFDVLSEGSAEVLMVSCVPCAHRREPPGSRHPFTQGHQDFGEAGPGVSL